MDHPSVLAALQAEKEGNTAKAMGLLRFTLKEYDEVIYLMGKEGLAVRDAEKKYIEEQFDRIQTEAIRTFRTRTIFGIILCVFAIYGIQLAGQKLQAMWVFGVLCGYLMTSAYIEW
jgi:hypothetical protein